MLVVKPYRRILNTRTAQNLSTQYLRKDIKKILKKKVKIKRKIVEFKM